MNYRRLSAALLGAVASLLLSPLSASAATNYTAPLSTQDVARGARGDSLTRRWHVKSVDKSMQALIKHGHTDIVTDNAAVSQRNIPWEGRHTLPTDTHGNITYYLNANNSALANRTYQHAINAWNRLNVIHLVQTKNLTDASIVLSTNRSVTSAIPAGQNLGTKPGLYPNANENDDFPWAGITYLREIPRDTSDIVIIRDQELQYNLDVSASKASAETINYTLAEHEIGHALGFAHDHYQSDRIAIHYRYQYKHHEFIRTVSIKKLASLAPVMNPYVDGTNSNQKVIPLGTAEANALKQHYDR